MKLYFVRHGQAEDRAAWAPAQDHLRPLTEAGKQRMRDSARTMRKLGLKPAVVLTSPLVRAVQTAEIVAKELGCNVVQEEALGPGFGVGALAELLESYGEGDSLLLVGHEPDFSATIEGLVGGGRVVVKKGSLIRVDLFSLTPPRGELHWMIPPKLLAL